MEPVLAIVVGAIFAAGVYLVLRPNMIWLIFGLLLLSSAVNLLIFTAGRLSRGVPPLIPADPEISAPTFANPLSQAMILTAIVIGFGLFVFTLVLVYRAYQAMGSTDPDEPSS